MSQPKRQLEMVRVGADPPPLPVVPDGYSLRQYLERDRASYWRLFAMVFETASRLDDLRTAALPGGFFVVEERATGNVVASAVAAEYQREGHPDPGSLQWVMTDPAHTGHGLGRAAIAAATAVLANGGYSRVYLSTDDWRLPAINLYLQTGWQPLLHAPDMEQRWLSIFDQLNHEPEPDLFVVEPH